MSREELDQEPFSVHEFVERLAWKTMGSKARSNVDEFDPMMLHSAFEHMIKDLKDKNVQVTRDIEKLETNCKEEEKRHWQRVAELQKKNQALYTHFQKLDERISYVATKVVHLGDQLEGVNTPRARAVEAQRLMSYLSEFLTDEPLKSPVLTDPFQLQLAADIIQKLHLIALELPLGGKFDRARKRIAEKYDSVERELIEEFKIAHNAGDRRKMKKIASVLQNFKAYGVCIDTFITESQLRAFMKANVFDDILPLCARTNELIIGVFTNPEMVMGKFVQNIFQTKLQQYIFSQLESKSSEEEYLEKLRELYIEGKELATELSKYKLGNDSSFLSKLIKGIFQDHLSAYIDTETKYLRQRCSVMQQRYYESKQHQKKQIQSGGIHDLKRDIQAKLGTVTKANIGPTIENYGGETFLSEEVSINILQETKMAFRRCQVLSYPSDLPSNAMKIYEVLVYYLVTDHIDYAVEIGLQAIPLPDPKTDPVIYFFDVVNQANTLFHLFEKQFMDSLVPLILASQKHGQCLKSKRELRSHLESKVDMGLDRSLSTIVGWIRHILSSEQKKSDFKPEADDVPLLFATPESTCEAVGHQIDPSRWTHLQFGPFSIPSSGSSKVVACLKIVKFLSGQANLISSSLDGKNVEVVLLDLGQRFHRVIFEHLLQFQYNIMGAMLLISDVNEYRKCIKEDFKITLLSQLFEKLHALCNLLVVVPENLKVIRDGEELADMDESVVHIFLQLRSDYKTARIASRMKSTH